MTQQGDLPGNLIDTLLLTDGDIFPNNRELVLVGYTSPIGSCEAERSFSALRRIQTYLRSTMTEERLRGLTLMYVHYSKAAQLDTGEVVKQFVRAHPRHLFCSSILFDWLGLSQCVHKMAFNKCSAVVDFSKVALTSIIIFSTACNKLNGPLMTLPGWRQKLLLLATIPEVTLNN